jgi:hypothetical protein
LSGAAHPEAQRLARRTGDPARRAVRRTGAAVTGSRHRPAGAAEETTRQRGGELLEINVDGDDVDARRFYERHGYRNSEPRSDEQLLYYFRELAR